MAFGEVFAIPFLADWTPICLIVQLTDRPEWRRLRRQPGFVACLLATAIIVFMVISASLSVSFASSLTQALSLAQVFGGALTGAGVLCGWAAMMLSAACRQSASWSDRLGRLTGVAWIAMGAICAIRFWELIR
jgi:hypothetical protein